MSVSRVMVLPVKVLTKIVLVSAGNSRRRSRRGSRRRTAVAATMQASDVAVVLCLGVARRVHVY